MAKHKPEVWLRGPLVAMTPLLQPVAQALLQAREEINDMMQGFPEQLLWEKVAGMASPGFHLQHLAGVIDRLFTYAKGSWLTETQLQYLAAEGKPSEELSVNILLDSFNSMVDKALQQIKETDEAALTVVRGVGRAQVPSTVIGLMVHSAEHTMRHTGQLLVTVACVKDNSK